MPLQPDQILNNRYKIIKLLGQGGFGAVYRAWDSNLNRLCALKENLNTAPEAVRQFAREATVLANLSHPNLPRVTDHFSIPGQGQYLVMDFVEGDDLESMVEKQGTVPYPQAIAWISQVMDALSYLHNRKPPVVHRDIKPANIRITPEGQAVLVDFGLVKIYDANMATTLGARAVTPGYAPPEQYGQGSTDPRTDIYALGATLYKLITGKEPLESIRRMVGSSMPTSNQVNPQIPPPISQAIERGMAIEPSQRFHSVADFKAALYYNQPRPTPPSPTMVVQPPAQAYHQPVAKNVAPQAERIAQSLAAPSKETQNFALSAGVIVLIAVCLIAASVFAGWYLSQHKRSDTPTPTGGSQVTSSELVFGPQNGALLHNPANGSIEAKNASVNLRDFIVEARFFNPYATSEGTWDYGFIFRHEGENRQFRLVLRSEGSWVLLNQDGGTQDTVIKEGLFSGMNLEQNGSNIIRLECKDNTGVFYINGSFISSLDLSARMSAGDIFVVTGVYEGDETNGKSTRYEGFSVWTNP